MAKIEYTPLNLPKGLVDELKIWRMAFSASYGRTITYADMIRGMLDSLEDTEPGVVAEMDALITRHPELGGLLGRWAGRDNDETNIE